jgi:hypothetical protein
MAGRSMQKAITVKRGIPDTLTFPAVHPGYSFNSGIHSLFTYLGYTGKASEYTRPNID